MKKTTRLQQTKHIRNSKRHVSQVIITSFLLDVYSKHFYLHCQARILIFDWHAVQTRRNYLSRLIKLNSVFDWMQLWAVGGSCWRPTRLPSLTRLLSPTPISQHATCHLSTCKSLQVARSFFIVHCLIYHCHSRYNVHL